MIFLYILLGALAASVVGLSELTRWGARHVLLSGGARRPLVIRPDDFKLAYEKVRFKTEDGLTLAGWFIPAKTATDRTLLLCHGWGTNKGELLPATSFLAEDFNLLYFDFRFCGESEGDLSSVGYLESRDFDAALAYLTAQKPELAERVGVYGLSMGAATAFMGAARHPEIRAAVIENPFPSYKKVMGDYAWHKWRIPRFPLIDLVAWHADRILGVDPELWSPRHFAAQVRPPVFLLHAENDPLTQVSESRALFEALEGEKELWIVAGAGHEDVHEVAGDEYRRRISAFFKRYL